MTDGGAASRASSLRGCLLRTLILDMPLALCFALYAATIWTHYVYDLYLEPQLKAMVWNDERMAAEQTYYMRWCDGEDQSAMVGSELFLPINATAQEAYDHQLRHGMTVFPSILSEQTATALRDYILSRNRKLTKQESIYVLAKENRYSFGLGTQEPTVARAVEEFASNQRLKAALEKIMGRNPALIEMTCITATYGAEEQGWHHDVLARASAMQFGRSFAPSYSIFIQLQNTTKEMGATEVSPGTHFCSSGKSFFNDLGFQVVGEDGYWRTGDALLMNMNCFHRGAAHTDPNGEDRVMFVLTFTPRPRSHAESRQLSHGITFSLNWDMWGHTLEDLAHASTRMIQPWVTLRALGLYKGAGADWGIDYITGGSMRMANFESGFRDDQLAEWLNHGGFLLLPSFLNGQVDLKVDGWQEYYLHTLILCEEFMCNAHILALLIYGAVHCIILAAGFISHNRSKVLPFVRFSWAVACLLIIHISILSLYQTAVNHVDKTQWARDIKGERRYTNPFVAVEESYVGPTTYPHREDILIQTRYNIAELAMYNDFVMDHPGNRAWKKLLESTASLYDSYSGLPVAFREHLSEFMVSSMESQQRRFLSQGSESNWHHINRLDAVAFNHRQLQISSSLGIRDMFTGLEYIISDCKHGHLRHTVMARKTCVEHLRRMQDSLLKEVDSPISKHGAQFTLIGQGDPASRPIKNMCRSRVVVQPECNSRFLRRSINLSMGVKPGEPAVGAWILEGTVVEVLHKDANSPYNWYYATVNKITSSGDHKCTFYEGSPDYFKPDFVRAYKPFAVGEKLEIWKGESFVKAVVLRVYEGGDIMDVKDRRNGRKTRRVFAGDVRRPNAMNH